MAKDASEILGLFAAPGLSGLIGDSNQGKSNLIYWLIEALSQGYDYNLYSYGLRVDLGEQKIHSVYEMEVVQNSVVIVDEFATIFDMDNRKEKRNIEQTLRLIYHNNNAVLLCGLPENYKKFIASKLTAILFKRCTIADFINGSRVKYAALNYRGRELGASVLDMGVDRCLVYDGKHYASYDIPYMSDYDTKASNPDILTPK